MMYLAIKLFQFLGRTLDLQKLKLTVLIALLHPPSVAKCLVI